MLRIRFLFQKFLKLQLPTLFHKLVRPNLLPPVVIDPTQGADVAQLTQGVVTLLLRFFLQLLQGGWLKF